MPTGTAVGEARLIALIEERTGIVLQAHQMDRFRQVVAEICASLDTDMGGYFEALSRNATDHPIYRRLIDQITINETYFFRDEVQIAFLRDVWLPELIRRRTAAGERSIRVWSAASSSGEELFTIAMLLRDLLAGSPGWRIRLLGTDIDDDALHKASEGLYSGWSFRSTPDTVRSRHFQAIEGGRYAIAQDMRDWAIFQHLNLATDAFPAVGRDIWNFDLILCRNVFIYFNRDVVRQVLKKLSASLAPDGIMMVGASDMVDNEAADLAVRHHGDAFYFVHRELEERRTRARHQASRRMPARPAPSSRLGTGRSATEAPGMAACAAPAAAGGSVEELGRNALAAAGRRDFIKAEAAIAAALAQAPHDPFTHLTAATVFAEHGNLRRAEEHARKAIYLDRRLVEGHFRLGHLLLLAGNTEGARRSLENALSMARQHPADGAVPGHEGITYGQLAEILQAEIANITVRAGMSQPASRRRSG